LGRQFSRVKTWIAGETLTASDLNAEFDNILNNFDPDGMDDASANATAMQATADPYPGATESLATDLRGEIQRLRYLIKQITGESQWYIDPDNTVAVLAANLIAPSTTEMLFIQNSAPALWTRNAARQDNAMLCYASSGNPGAGGSGNPQSTHTHTGPSHTHTGPSHTHTGPSHYHDILNVGLRDDDNNIAVLRSGVAEGTAFTSDIIVGTPGASSVACHSLRSNSAGTGATGAEGTGDTGAAGTGATGANTAPYYQECISCVKD
jgi:hypothetical protein